MFNGENWLVHSDLFQKHWIIETKSWARNLGWFSSIIEQVRLDTGWSLFGNVELSVTDYVSIIDAPGSEKILYKYNNGDWTYIRGPVLFVIKKNEDETYIAGWAGDKKTITQCKKKYSSPWEWPNLNTIEIIPTIANSGFIPFVEGGNFTPSDTKVKLPVFFLSNGETNAEENWEHLHRICPRAVRVDRVTPRRNAFLKCAELAGNTSYFFVVTAKNLITDTTVFDYTPDNSVPYAHIMFQARNMSNRLEYGHMAVGCYNKALILSTPEVFGLDITEYGKIYPVPITVSDAYFATTPLEAWRTAFREAVKLTLKDTILTNKWLNRWESYAEGEYSDWVLRGAADGKEYALDHRYDIEALLQTERWDWLETFFKEKYLSLE